MAPLKYIRLGSDTNLWVINTLAYPIAHLYLDVTLHRAEGDREIKLPVRVDPNTPIERRLFGVSYGLYMPVLACHPISDTEFYTEVGYTEVPAKYFDLCGPRYSHWAYMGELPDVKEATSNDARFVAPLRVYEIPKPDSMSNKYFRQYRIHGASLRLDSMCTSALDNIDDATWEQLTLEPSRGFRWSDFLNDVTEGRMTCHEDLSDCLEGIDQEYIPENIVKRLLRMQTERRLHIRS